MKTALITGATGFIGRQALKPLLNAGYEIHGVGSHASAQENVRWHKVDLLDGSQAAQLLQDVRPTHLLHLAWMATPGQYWTSPDNERWLAASKALIAEFVRCGGERIVVAGTCAEYDWSQARDRYTEDAPVGPTTPYGRSKAALFQYLQESLTGSTPNWGWGRIFWLYGPYEHPSRLVPSIIRPLLAGSTAPCTEGLQKRDFSHVADVAGALAALLDSAVTGAVNVGSGEAVAVRSIAEKLARLCGHPELLRPGELSTPAQPDTIAADTGRLNRELGWKNTFSLDSGLQSTVEWWRSQE